MGKSKKSKQIVPFVPDPSIPVPPKDDEELALEKLVFGDVDGFGASLKQVDRIFEYSSDEFSSGDEDDQFSVQLGSDAGDSVSDEETADNFTKMTDDQLFFVDDGEQQENDMELDDSSSETESDDNAWTDSDDEKLDFSIVTSDKLRKLRETEQEQAIRGRVYINRLRSQFEKIYPRPKWADEADSEEKDLSESDEEDEEDEDVTSSSNPLVKFLKKNSNDFKAKSYKMLPVDRLDIAKSEDANAKHPSRSGIQTMSFHPTHPLLLTGGFDRTLRIYNVDTRTNKLVTSLHLRKMPVQTAGFMVAKDTSRTTIFAGGRRRYMYKWDVNEGSAQKISRMYGHEATQRSFENFKISRDGTLLGLLGNSGWINVLNTANGQWVKGFKIEGTLVDCEFTADNHLFGVNSAGEVWEWDLASDKIVARWQDESGVGITRIRSGGKNGRWLAIGSNTGIVNVYDRSAQSHSPMGTVESLVTTISSLEFSPDGQILCIASRDKKDALRMVHMPTCRVFGNWPTSNTPLGRVTSVCFSNGGELLFVGNDVGKVRTFILNHYF